MGTAAVHFVYWEVAPSERTVELDGPEVVGPTMEEAP
jgi:hypothetical protein